MSSQERMDQLAQTLRAPCLSPLSPEPAGFRQELDTEQGIAVIAIRSLMGEAVRESLPPELQDNIIYPPFLSGEAAGWINGHPNLAVHVPRHRHELAVQGVIKQTAEEAAKKLFPDLEYQSPKEVAQAIHNLRVAMNAALRSGIVHLNESQIIYVSPTKKCTPKEAEGKVCEVQSMIDSKNIPEEYASVVLFWLLGSYSDEEIHACGRAAHDGVSIGAWRASFVREDLSLQFLDDLKKFNLKPLAEELHTSLVWAREFLDEKIQERINPLIKAAVARGEIKGKVKMPSFNQTLRGEDLFTLLKVLFNKESTPDDANDAQILVNFAIIHWIFERRKKNLQHVQKIDEIDDQIEREMFEMDESGTKNREVLDDERKMLAYDEEKKEFRETESEYEARCRVLKVDEEYADIPEKQRLIYLDRMGEKSVESSVIKFFNPGRDNKRSPDQMPDELRTRLIAWNVNSQDFEENPRLKQMYIKHLEAMGEKLGLAPYKVNDELHHEHFPKLTLSGKNKDGINVEIQLLPIDTHKFADAHGSWFDHEKLEELRDLEMLLVPIPYSVSPISHKVGQRRIREIKAKRDDCRMARKTFLTQRAQKKRPTQAIVQKA